MAMWEEVVERSICDPKSDEMLSDSVGILGDLHGISSEFPNDPCTSDC